MTPAQQQSRAWKTSLFVGTAFRTNAGGAPPVPRAADLAVVVDPVEDAPPSRRAMMNDLVRWSNDHVVLQHLHPRHKRAQYTTDDQHG